MRNMVEAKREIDLIVPNITKAEESKIKDFCSSLGLFTYRRKAKEKQEE